MRFTSLASGSSGNVSYIGTDNTHILVDAGISNKRIELGLNTLGLKPSELSGIFITHEHSDHIQGLKVFSKKYQIPIYASRGTIEAICDKGILEGREELLSPVEENKNLELGELCVEAFHIYHDAREPVGYRVSNGSKHIAIATDMGHYDDYIVDMLSGLDAILLEANHDVRMLEVGRYPYELKRRILGDIGHLSNENAGRLLCEILHDNMQKIYLGHLSRDNNYPELCYEAVRYEISSENNKYKADDFYIEVAARDQMSSISYI